MWPCCDFTSSDDDEHNTDNNFLLLFVDVYITPTLLEGLTEVDVRHIALGCRFALDILRFRSNFPLRLIMSHFLMILSSPHFEHGCYTRHVDGHDCHLMESDSHSKYHSVWEVLVVTQCQFKTC